MTTIIVVDTKLRDQLWTVRDVVEFRDTEDHILGRYARKRATIRMTGSLDDPSDEELDRRMREGRNYTTDEVLAILRTIKLDRDRDLPERDRNIIDVDLSFREDLIAAGEEAELTDSSGRVLGRFFAMPQPIVTVTTPSGQVIMVMPHVDAPAAE